MSLGVSVIICTYNGAERLPKTLQYLALQEVPADIPWEVILIDNASTDLTSIVAKKEWAKYDVSFGILKIVEQPTPGKNHALEKGFLEARYEYIIICDDDNWLYPNYLITAVNVLQMDSSIAVVGGCGIFEPEQPKKKEIEGFENYYINGKQKNASTQHWVYGAGSVLRKKAFFDIINKKWPLITSGRIGSKLNGGEDVEFCFMAYLTGYKIISDDRLLFKHYVPLERQDLEYIYNLTFWVSYANMLLNSYFTIIQKDETPIKIVLKKLYFSSIKSLAKQSTSFFYQKIMTSNDISISRKIAFQSILGTFTALYKNRKKIIDHHNHIKCLLSNIDNNALYEN